MRQGISGKVLWSRVVLLSARYQQLICFGHYIKTYKSFKSDRNNFKFQILNVFFKTKQQQLQQIVAKIKKNKYDQ